MCSDQVIRWYRLAQTSLNQRVGASGTKAIAYLRGYARRENITAEAAAALAGPPAGTYATVLAALIPDGQSPALVRPLSGLRDRDEIQHVSGHQVLRARVPCNQVAVPPAEREHVAAIEGDRGRRCGNKLGEQAPASPVPAARGARCGCPLIS
jgi:hypothetical protein